MKRFNLAVLFLGMVASATFAQEYETVEHKTTGDLANELTNMSVEYLKIVCVGDAVMSDNDFVAIRANLRPTLKGIDFSEAAFPYNSVNEGGMNTMINVETVILPEGLTGISKEAFYYCEGLVNIEIPNSVTKIGDNAFFSCGKLVIDRLPESLEYIGVKAFCSDGTTNTAAGGTRKAADAIPGVTASVLPEGVTFIGEAAFNNTNVTFEHLPEGITTIGRQAFRNTNVSIKGFPEGLFQGDASLGDAVFVNCLNVTEFTIPYDVTTLPNQIFYWDKQYTMPRTFYCYAATPPTASYDTGGYTGAFGNASSFEYITFYVPEESLSQYSETLPYSTMTLARLFTQTERKVSDFFTFEGGDEPNVAVSEVVNGEAREVNFDMERTYTLRFSPSAESMMFISRIAFVSDVAPASLSDDPNVIYDAELDDNNNTYVKPVEVDVPLKADTKVLVTLAPADGVSGISSAVMSESGSSRVFNLQGICVAEGENVAVESLPAGLYIVKTGNSSKKIVIK